MSQDVVAQSIPTVVEITGYGNDPKARNTGAELEAPAVKRRCISTACIACRRRKSKCDGNLPKCAACASVYLTECEYAPNTDNRRKGVYKKEADSLKTKNSTLQTLIQSLLNLEEDDAVALLRRMRVASNLEDVVQSLDVKEEVEDNISSLLVDTGQNRSLPRFDTELSSKMGDLLIDGSVKFIGGTSNLVWMDDTDTDATSPSTRQRHGVRPQESAIISWTMVCRDKALILHFLNMYFCWHYPYFTTLSKELFYRDFLSGTNSQYCSSILVNAMLALGCHFSAKKEARADPEDSSTTGDHYFAEAKRLIYENEELMNAKLSTVQALALMSVREAGVGREGKGWVYSGMSFRMASDLGLNIDAPPMSLTAKLKDEDIDARRITFWGCFLFDKCWSNYLGRQPQLQLSLTNTKKFDVFPSEDAELWSPYTDNGLVQANAQPARTRTIALQILKLAEISSDLLASFYQPSSLETPPTRQSELKKLSDIHTRLEAWKQALPAELDARDGQLPHVLLMHMFYQLLYIHLYRPFLRYTKSTSPLPAHVSPRKFCTQAASMISKLLRLYKRTYGLRQIINKVVYIAHSACTIHLLNLPDKNAKRDIVHGIKQLEEMGECWVAARRTLRILSLCAERWNIELSDEVKVVLSRCKIRWRSPEPSNSPTAPDGITGIVQQIGIKPTPGFLAQNMLLRAGNTASPQQAVNRNSGTYRVVEPVMPHQSSVMGMIGQSIPSPADTDYTRRSSGNFSLPPATASELIRNAHRNRPSTHLTQRQQDAWSALQARMHNGSVQHTRQGSGSAQAANATAIFGGVDSLMEDSQDWWYKDQTQLAQGFEHWPAPEPGWLSPENDCSQNTTTPHLPAAGGDGLFSRSSLNSLDPNTKAGDFSLMERASQQSLKGLQGPHRSHALYQQTQKRYDSWEDDMYYQ